MSTAPTIHIEHLLPDYLAGKLTDDEKIAVDWHLRVCEACRSTNESLAVIFAATRIPSHSPGSAYFSTILPRVRTRMEQGGHRRRFFGPVMSRLVLPLAATALVLLSLVTLSTNDNGDVFGGTLKPLIAELGPDDVSDVLNGLDSVPLIADERLVTETVLEQRLNNAGLVPQSVVREALAEQNADLEVDDLTSVLEDNDWKDVLTKLDKRTIL